MMKCKIVLFALLLFGLSASANTFVEKEKVIQKSFTIDTDGTVDISNKYGDVTIVTGTGNKVEIEVKIVVETNNDAKALEIYDRINIEFSNSSSRVTAATTIANGKKKWWKGWWNNGNSKFKIHYNVNMPSTAHLKVANKYGNTYSESLENGADVWIKYGKIEMKDVSGPLNVEMKYSKGTIASGGDGKIYAGYSTLKMKQVGNIGLELSYSNYDVQTAGDIELRMKYSKLHIGDMKNLRAYSKYDHINIGEVAAINYEGKYTSLNIDRLLERANLDMGYGSAKIYNIQPNFSEIKIYSKYTGVKLGFMPETGYQVDVECKHTSLKHSGLETSIDIQKNSEKTLKGYHGNRNGGVVYARMNYGGLTLD